MKKLNENFSENDIYKWYVDMTEEGRIVRDKPFIGKDGRYHKLYMTKYPKMFYIGKHSWKFLYDEYYGSGYDIKDGSNEKKSYEVIVLEYFDSAEAALAAEKRLVNPAFLTYPFVLNHAVGGDGKTPLIPGKPTAGSWNGIDNGWPFSALKVPVGGVLNFIEDESKICYVVNDWAVNYCGQIMSLRNFVIHLCGYNKYPNPLNAIKYKGKKLTQIRDELRASM